MKVFEKIETSGFLEVHFSAELINIDKIALLTDRFLTSRNLKVHDFSIHLVMRELLNNAVIHGCGRDHDKSVRYRLGLEGTYLTMQVEDEGEGFNWREQIGKKVELYADHGRGVFILDEYCTSYRYNEKGNEVTANFEILNEKR